MNELKRLMDADAFLGRGWSFPLELTEDGVKMSSYEKDIEESLRILFSTTTTAAPCAATPSSR